MAKPKLRNLPDLAHLTRPGQSIPVRVTPKAAQDRISFDGATVHIAVTAVPEDGKANQAVVKLLARAMGASPSALTLKKGHTGRDKVFVYDP